MAREQWIIANISNKPITLGDISNCPMFLPGKQLDVLPLVKREDIIQSQNLILAVKAGWLTINKILDGNSTVVNASNVNSQITENSTTGTGTVTPTPSTVGITIDGGGSVITSGLKGFYVVPYACTIVAATLVADQSGTIAIEIWKNAAPTPPSSSGNKINASAPPALSSAQYSTNTTLSGWTKSVSAGDIIGFNVLSSPTIASVTKVTLTLTVARQEL